MSFRPGEIYFSDLDGTHPHPVVVVSRESLNRGDQVIAAIVTLAQFEKRSKLANCVPVRSGQFGLNRDCVVQCSRIPNVDVVQLDRDNGPIGELDDDTMRDVIRALGYVFDADCDPT